MTTNENKMKEIVPSEGMHLKNRKTGQIHEGKIYTPVTVSESDFIEVTEAEYQEYIAMPNESEAV